MHWCLWIAYFGLVTIYLAEGAGKEDSRAVIGRLGESVILRCDLLPHDEGRPPHYVIEWVRFGFLLPIFIKFGLYSPRVDPEYLGRTRLEEGASLQVDLLRSEDQGWYECRVLFLDLYHSDEDFRNGTWIHLTVNSPPSFRETPPALVEVRDGDAITLTCVATGNPPPRIVWKQDDRLITTGGDQLQVNNGSLKIGRVQRSSAGVYTCHATSGEGEITHTTRLLVQGPPVIVVPPENTTVNISHNAFLACQAEAYPANLTYIWLQGNSNVFHLSHLQSRVRVLVDGSLLLQQVIPEDSGKYTCVPSNGILKPPSASAYLTVLHPAKVTAMPLDTYLPIGMQGVLKCPVRANPPLLFVNWTKDGQPLDLRKFPGWYLQHDGSVVIATGNDDALGMYTCTPYNSYGTAGESTPTRVLLKDPPEFVIRPKEEYFQEVGRELIVPCSAKGDPTPIITWAKLGNPGRSGSHMDVNSSLVFRPLTKEEHGIWECTAASRVARISTLTSIYVLGTSPHAAMNVSVVPLVSAVNVSWDPGFDGGYFQRFSVWVQRLSRGHHEWTTLAVPVGSTHLLVEDLQADAGYQFSVLSQNKLGSGPFSEIVPAYPLAFAVTTVVPELPTTEPVLVLSAPRSLTANETSRGVLLRWAPPLHASVPLTSYALEFRQDDGGWELLDDTVAGSETEHFVPGLMKDFVYEFRLVAFAGEYISDPSNTVNISTHGMEVYPSRTQLPDILPQPVMAGVIAGICFLCMAVVFSLLAAYIMNRRRALRRKRRQDLPIVFSPNKKSSPSQNSNGSGSSDSVMKFKMQTSPYQSFRKTLLWDEKAGTSFVSRAARGNGGSSKYAIYESHFGESIALERISRGPDGRFMVEPETQSKAGNIEGFPYVTETELYPEFHTRESSEVSQCLEARQEPYLQVSSSPEREKTAWENEVTLRPKATGQARREALASGYRQGRYFDHSSPMEVTKPLSIIDISPVTSTVTLPYSKIEEKRQEAKSPEEKLDRTVSALKESDYDYSLSLPHPGSASSLLKQKPFALQTKGSRLSASAQSGILQYLSLPFFKEMSVDGEWPLEEEHSQQDFDMGSSKQQSQDFQTVLGPDERTLLISERLSESSSLEKKGSPLSHPDYMDTRDNHEALHRFSPVKSFLKPPEPELGPSKAALPGSHLWTCQLSEDSDRYKTVDPTHCGQWLSRTQSPVDCRTEKAFNTAFPLDREWESSLKEHPGHELTDFHMLEKQKPLPIDKPLAPLFLHVSSSEKVLRNSLTSQSSGRGSVSYFRPSSLAQSFAGSYLSSPLGETASWHSGGGSQGSNGEDGRHRKEALIPTIGKRRNTSVDENYEWDTDFTVETDILDALQLYRSGHPKRPISTIAVRELERQSLKVPIVENGAPGNSSSVDVLDFSRSRVLSSPEERCAALKEEFLEYRRRGEAGQQGRMSAKDFEDGVEQSTLL
ncbi:protein turtle homolog A isoform X2 [Ambystoma mexicanum]|uniref:protein turtle homolog A isoform X2 n=1 Tax=Ambystoma mexicanum TaxID=8296 RepID=UPI0037E8472B